MWRVMVLCVVLCGVGADDYRHVTLDEGVVIGQKYWNGDYYEFYGVPYASVPTGLDRFKAPLPPKPWTGVLDASLKNIVCYQCHYTEEPDEETMLTGDEECLTMNLFVPELAQENNLLPVVVYIHSGAYAGGSGNMAKFNYLTRHDIIAISFNYRLGAIGFVCLGNEEIPGNAGLKDQVAALRWINKNIQRFGGDPTKITLAGFSVGAAMVEILALSKSTDGLFNKIILESGSALSPFAINRDPIDTAQNIAKSLGYNGTTLKDLTDFYINADVKDLAEKSVNYFIPNSTFGFSPCIENNIDGIESILTESPLDIMKTGQYNNIAVLTGFSNMEGISRTIKFGSWRDDMNKNFANFLPADLTFNSEKSRDNVVKEIKKYYFKNKEINIETLQSYVNFFSDSMFKYGIMKSAKLHASISTKPVYLYEFSYVGKLNMEHNYMNKIKGASHRDQTAYVLDFFGHTNNYKDLDTRERMTTMWADFIKYEDPTLFESPLITLKWLPYTNETSHYLEINRKLQLKKNLFKDGYNFWEKVYTKRYWNPTAPELKKVVQN